MAKDFKSQIDRTFTTYRISDDEEIATSFTRRLCRDLAVELSQLCPPNRELSLALTKLEEVMFFANASISREGGSK